MFVWSGQQDLNLRPSGPKPDALPDCAMPRLDLVHIYLAHILVGEPVTSPDQVRARLSPGYALRGSLRYTLRSWPARRLQSAGHKQSGPTSIETEPENHQMAGCLVRRRAEPRAFRPLRRHQALGAGPETDQDELAGPQLSDAVAAERLHVHEDVGRPLPAREKAEAAQPVEPLDLRPLEPAGRGD